MAATATKTSLGVRASAATVVDVHSHCYPPSFIALLTGRTEVPYIYQPPQGQHPTRPEPRLIILPSDDDASLPLAQRGRPIDDSYSSLERKLDFMDAHAIDISVLSLANPWLDWVAPQDAARVARQVNDDMEQMCAAPGRGRGRLFFFATLPVSAATGKGGEEGLLDEVKRLASGAAPHCKGVILGTTGLGNGLDDTSSQPLSDLYAALQDANLPIFLHPHYGLPSTVFGPHALQSAGHVLPLALGFPLETTIAFARMYVSGVFARFKRLRLLLAHAGGAVPFLAGRLDSCVRHERALRDPSTGELKQDVESVWDVLRRNVLLDAVVYSAASLRAAAEVLGPEGSTRLLFGTDHPFFPPIGADAVTAHEWESVQTNRNAIREAFGMDTDVERGVLGQNAIRALGLFDQ